MSEAAENLVRIANSSYERKRHEQLPNKINWKIATFCSQVRQLVFCVF